MKYIKKVINILLIFVLLVPMFVAPYVVNAADKDDMTVKELEEEIAKEEAALANNKSNIKLTEAEITKIQNNIKLISKQIAESTNEISKIREEIIALEENIKSKKGEIYEIVRFLEVSNGESDYLEYMFGAKTFTDFIYRMAITEQLTNYNDRLIKEYNDMIVSNKQKQVDLNKEIGSAKAKQAEIASESMKLQANLVNLKSDGGSIEESLKETKSTLNDLKSKGCRDDETVRTCATRIYGVPISSSGMIRPLRTGIVTAEFGEPRPEGPHGGIDIGVPVGTPVYAVADGIVSGVWDYGGTGMSIHIIHIINGVRYTSGYQHLSKYEVYVGQTVRRGDEIALSGNTGYSFGPHLHFTLLYGWAGPIKDFHDYGIWSTTYWGMWFNPRAMINF